LDLLRRKADDDGQVAPAREPLAADRPPRSRWRDDDDLVESGGDVYSAQ
jgi:hypothetical protein